MLKIFFIFYIIVVFAGKQCGSMIPYYFQF